MHDLNVPPQRRVVVPQHRHEAAEGGADAGLRIIQLLAEVVAELGDELHEAPEGVGLGVLPGLIRQRGKGMLTPRLMDGT